MREKFSAASPVERETSPDEQIAKLIRKGLEAIERERLLWTANLELLEEKMGEKEDAYHLARNVILAKLNRLGEVEEEFRAVQNALKEEQRKELN